MDKFSSKVHSAHFFFFFGWCYSYGPQQGPDRQQKKEEIGLKQRRKQKEAAQGDPEPKKGNQEKEKNQVEYRVEGAQDRRRRRKPGGWKETPNTRKKGGETHIVAVVETRAASIEAPPCMSDSFCDLFEYGLGRFPRCIRILREINITYLH